MKRKAMREFIRENKAEIDAAILRIPGARAPTSNQERADWIVNDEGLYNWARSEGVRI